MSTDSYRSLAIDGLDMARRLVLKAKAGRGRTAVSVLTYPAPDLDGDFVRPDGGKWTARPFVNWNHDIPVGTGRVVLKSLTEDDGKTHVLPVGTTTFAQRPSDLAGVNRTKRDPASGKAVGTYSVDECLRAADDVFELVSRELATGVSIEFLPDGARGQAWWPLPGRSPINDRPSYHFEKWNGLGWAHAPEPINRSAALLINDLPEGVQKAFSIAQTGRFPGGRQLTEIVRKAFDPLLSLSRKATATGGWDGGRPETPPPTPVEKSMDEPVPEDVGGEPVAGAASGLKPTARAVMTVVQGIYDLCQQAEAMLDGPDLEHEGGMKLLRTAIDKLKGEAGKVHDKAAATFPDQGLEKPGDDVADAEPDADGDDDVLEDDTALEGDDESADYPEMTEDGAVVTKAFRKGIPGIQRFKLSQLKDIPAKPVESDAVDPALARRLRRLLKGEAKIASAVNSVSATLKDLS